MIIMSQILIGIVAVIFIILFIWADIANRKHEREKVQMKFRKSWEDYYDDGSM